MKMKRKCLICEEEAQYAIKDTMDYYCKECATEQFGDISYLILLEESGKANQQKKDSENIKRLEEEQELIKNH